MKAVNIIEKESVKGFAVGGPLRSGSISFEEYLPLICQQYCCPYFISVKKEYQQDEFYRQLKTPKVSARYKKISVVTPNLPASLQTGTEKTDNTATTRSDVSNDGTDTINITTFYDNANNLVEISLKKLCHVPRSLIQIIGYLVSSYDYLTKITLNSCTIDSYIIYELSKTIKMSSITDICLDGSTVLEGNYFIFLDHQETQIRYLSLCRCKVNDEVCKEIAIRLHYLCPAERTLLLLNLSSNHITDEGANYLGQALRSNRRLRYLNVADNRITDDGAACILDSLKEFCLTYAETMSKRKRRLEYLKIRRTYVMQYLNDMEAKSIDEYSRKSGVKKRRSATSLKSKVGQSTKRDKNLSDVCILDRAEGFADAFLGPYTDPFAPFDTKIKDGMCYSLGNMVLCYLNLAYNQLAYPTVKKLLGVLQYQKDVKKNNQSGILKINIEGNQIPITCSEYQNINDFNRLSKGIQKLSARVSNVSARLKVRTSSRSKITPMNLTSNSGRN